MFILERLTDIIAPLCCLKCGQEGSIVCEICARGFCVPLQPRCYRCLKPSKNFAVCGACGPQTPLKHVWVASQLKDLPEQLIHTFKFERAQAAAPVVARFMSQRLPKLTEGPLVVSVPSATSRVRQRGYDHAALLARTLARERRLSYSRVLSRQGQSRQVGATRAQRLTQLRYAFRVLRPTVVKGRYILLVDDVVTTGATLEEVAKTLRRFGAKQIDALVFAQK